jgi:lipoprotein-anchoring transpeptidase ErfK/SrfK
MASRVGTAALLTMLAALAGCGGGGGEESSTTTSSTTETTTVPPPEGGEATAGTIDLYFTTGEQFHKVDGKLPAGGSAPRQATKALLAGPTKADHAQTTIPDGVSLHRVTVEDGIATIDVSSRFLAGIPAQPAARSRDQEATLDARLGQLTYTLSQLDGVDSVAVIAGGAPVSAGRQPADYAKPEQGPLLFSAPQKPKAAAKTPGTREVQERLAKLRFLPRSAVDGVDGYRTQQAVIAFQAWSGLDRDGVVGPQTTAALARAHRPKPQPGGPDHRVEVYRSKGVALLIEHGRLKRAIHISSGGPATPTPAGRYEVFRKELKSWSVPFQVWLPYASYFNEGIAFHEYPDVPTYPASHGCVRVPAPEAKGVYEFASLGTVVVVF